MADNAEAEQHAILNYPGGELELDIVKASEGADGIALGSLLAKTGYTTFDGGFVNTASTKSAITYIDGDAGILRYRGVPIEQLAEKSTFIEVSYLLIYGELPSKEQLEKFTTQIQRHTLLHEDLKRFFDGFPRNAHPMPVLSSAVNALSAYYQDSLDRLLQLPIRRLMPAHFDEPESPQRAIKLLIRTIGILERGVKNRLKEGFIDLRDLTIQAMGEKIEGRGHYATALAVMHSFIDKFNRQGSIEVREIDPPYEQYRWIGS